MATPADIENLRAVFMKIMQTHQLRPTDIKPAGSRIAVPDKGMFMCPGCMRSWNSNFSWITFDLSHLEIYYRWIMKCKRCYVAHEPTFTVAQLQTMFDKVVVHYKGEDRNGEINIGYSARRIFRQPHMPELCEKCRWGAEYCWTRKFD